MLSAGKETLNGHAKEQGEKPTKAFEDIAIKETQHGVYRLCVASKKRSFVGSFKLFVPTSFHWPRRLLADVHSIEPVLVLLLLSVILFEAFQEAYLLKVSNDMLHNIESSLANGTPFTQAIVWPIAVRTLFSILQTVFIWGKTQIKQTLKRKIVAHFDLYTMNARVKRDLPTSNDATSKSSETDSEGAYSAFDHGIMFVASFASMMGQLLVTARAAKESGGSLFMLLCLLRPFSAHLFWPSGGYNESLIYSNNADFLRYKAMKECVDTIPQQDILSGNLGEWIIAEYMRAWKKIQNLAQTTAIEHEVPWHVQQLREVIWTVLSDLPLMFYAFKVYRSSDIMFSLADLAILEATSQALTNSVWNVMYRSRNLHERCTKPIKEMYQAGETENMMVDGAVPYPPQEAAQQMGMEVSFENVSFSYPGAPDTTFALKNLSLRIPTGSLVVVVGGNGSGKSTLIKVLARLYDPTSGELNIDGRPARDYRMRDLRTASVFLSQDNTIYPLSFAENIGLGCVEYVDNVEMIEEAARKGGAAEFISKREAKYDTCLKATVYPVTNNLHGKEKKEHPLNKKLKELEKKVEISGGETQRIVAARSFMRMNSGKIRLVTVDEPSSALDAEGELALFNNLLKAQEGKTMIFVTHRFGHLTKKADLIICMKDGTIAEMGPHKELMTKDGEYAKLYDIQAKAFPDESTTK